MDDPPGVCPLPIRPTLSNRGRFSPADCMGRFSIFREHGERILMAKLPPHPLDWPELIDEYTLARLQVELGEGIEIDRAIVEQAIDGLKRITPSSPSWGYWGWLADPEVEARLLAKFGFS